MSIAIGCDEAAFEMKKAIKKYIEELGHKVEDYGIYTPSPVLYPDIAVKVAMAIANGTHDRGIILCGTGIGMAITANKVPGICAAVVHDPFSAERARKSNNAQIMTMGSRVIGIELAKSLVKTWLDSEFLGGGSLPKVERIMEYEQQFQRAQVTPKQGE
jgi:ribose 5-phosphate isomerase B